MQPNSSLPVTFVTPMERQCASMMPSSSSTTMTFSTLFANARIFSTGRGWIMPSFSTGYLSPQTSLTY